MIPVTKPFFPPIDEYRKYIEGIWSNEWLSNDGPLVRELEEQLRVYLGAKHLVLVSNGTLALQLAIKSLGLRGEIITTPLTHVATSASIVWENCTPTFVDIDAKTFNLNPELIESAITKKTTAILATHVYGNPCNINLIQDVARKHKLKVIYDAAHCFGVKYQGESVLNHGAISTISFHATKLFHSCEGGALITNDPQLDQRLRYLRNFGHDGPGRFNGVGINGKLSEVHAAMGLVNLKYANVVLEKRRLDHQVYDELLDGLGLCKPKISEDVGYNYSYYPVVFESEEKCIQVLNALEDQKIYARRYFYPELGCLNYVSKHNNPVARNVSQRVLCLPLFFQISRTEIELICRTVKKVHE